MADKNPFATEAAPTDNPFANPDYKHRGAVSRGFETAIRQIPQTAGGALALLGDAVGSKGLREAGMGIYKGQEEKIQALSNPSDSFSNVLDGSGDVGEFLKHGAGYVGGQALTAVGTGGIGALVGRKLVEKGIAGEAAKLAASGLAEKGALEVAKQEALKTAAKRGAIAGAGAMNVMQEEGSIYPEALAQAEKDGRLTADGGLSGGDIARVGLSGLGAAALDTAMEGVMAGKLLKGGGGSTLARRAMKEVPAGMAREGVTEGLQTGVERFGAQQSLGDQEAIRDYIDSAALGALGGGLGGGAAAIAGGRGKTAMQTAAEAQTAPTADGSIPYERVAIPQSGGLALQEPGAQSADVIPYQQTLAPYDGQLGVEGEQKPAGYQPRPEDAIDPGTLTASAKPQQEASAIALPGADVMPEIGQTSASAAPLPAITPEAVTQATGINPAAGPLSAAAHVVVTQQMTKTQEALAGLSKLGRMTTPTQAPAGPITVSRMDDAQVRQMQKEGGFGAGFGTPGLVDPVVRRLGELPNRQGSFAEMSQKAESNTQKSANPFTTVAAPEYSKPSATTNEGKDMHVPRDVALGVKQEGVAPVKRNVIKEAADRRKAEEATETEDLDVTGRPVASWVVRRKGTGEVLFETYDKKKVAALNTEKYEAVPIGKYLGSANTEAKRNVIKEAADKRLEDTFKKAPHELTPKQYHEQTIRDVMREYNLSRREALENYDTEPARKEHGQRWVRHVQEQFKSGAEVSAKTLDNLEKIRPGAFASFIHDSPDAKVPTGYQPPSARAVEAEKMAERSADKKAVREEYRARRTGGAEGLEPSSTAVKAGDLPRRIAGPAKSAAKAGASGLDLQPQPDSSTRPAPKAGLPAKRNVLKEAADRRKAKPWKEGGNGETLDVVAERARQSREDTTKQLQKADAVHAEVLAEGERLKKVADAAEQQRVEGEAKRNASREAADKRAAEEGPVEHAGYAIRQTRVRSGDAIETRWAVQTQDNKERASRGERQIGGDSLHQSLDAAKAEAERQAKRQEADRKFQEEIQEREKAEAETKRAREADDMGGFLTGKEPNAKALARKTLEKLTRLNSGAPKTLREHIDDMHTAGTLKTETDEEPRIKPMSRTAFNRASNAEQEAHEKRMKEAGTKTVYYVNNFDLGKTAFDYANHLLNKGTPKNGTEQSDNRGSGERAVPDAERGASTEGASTEGATGANAEPANGRGTDLPGEPGAGTGQTGAVAGATDGGPTALTKGKPKTDAQMYAEIDAALKTAMPTDKARELTLVADLEARQRKDEADRQYAKDIKRNPTGAARAAVVNARNWEYTKADQVRGAAYAEQIGTVTFENGGSKWKVLNTVAKLMALRDTFAPNAGKGKPDRLGMERANPFGGRPSMETLQKRYPDLKIEEDKPDPTPPTGGKPTPATKEMPKDEKPDWMSELFGAGSKDGTPAARTESKPGRIDSKTLVPALRKFVDDRIAEANDWNTRKYKSNEMTVALDGDGPTRAEALTINRINEGRRNKTIAALKEQAQAASILANKIERGRDVQADVANVEQAMERDIVRDGGIHNYKSRDDMFEAYISSMLLDDPYRAHGPDTVARMIRDAYQNSAQTEAPAAKETPKKGITPTWLKDLGISNGETLNFDIPEQFAQGALTVKKATKDEVVLTSARGSSTVLRKRDIVRGLEDGRITKADGAKFKQGRATQSPGLQSAEIDKALAPTLAGWKNAPKVATVQSVADLPFDAPDDARGAYLDGKVYLVADNLSSPQEARFVLLHESLGHGGLSGVLGGRLNLVMRTMYAQNEVLRSAADKTGIKDKAVAVEEVLADMAGADPQAIARLTGFDKLVANVRAWLRNHGFGVKWSDKDIINLLQQAGRHIENGRNGEPHVFGAESAKFMTAWHGSPHDFEKFDSQHMGTGEGAQAFGWGHYFAGRKEVAEWYRDALSEGELLMADGSAYDPSNPLHWAASGLWEGEKNGLSRLEVASEMRKDEKRYRERNTEWAGIEADKLRAAWVAITTAPDTIPGIEHKSSGRLYQADIPGDSEMMQWDVPFREQPKSVRDGMKAVAAEYADVLDDSDLQQSIQDGEKGDAFYRLLSRVAGSPQNASKDLRRNGVRGIKYLDGTSRADGEGSHNYVIFDDADVKVEAKFSRKSPQEVTDDSVSDSPEKWAYQTKQWAGKDKASVVEVGSVSGAKLYHEGIAQPYGMGQITAVDLSGNVVGTAFYDRRDNDGKLEAAVEVSPSNRRRGIATAMYDAIESIRGEKLSPAENRTAYASAFWRKRSGNSGSFNPDTADTRFSRKSLPDTINVDGKDRPTTNSNGKPIAQTEEGVRNFWKWFGDSKVVVDVQPVSRSAYASFQGLEPPTRVAEANPPAVNARPFVLYHGTNANVKAFDQSAGGRSTGHAGAALGTYLTSKPVLADYYADMAARDGKSGQNVVPVYVALQNPKRYESASAFYREADGFVGRDADWRKALESEGFDGVIVRDDFEEVIAFDPAQIKSATGNSGSFNPENPDIRFSRKSPEESEAIRERAAAAIADRDLRNSAANNARDMLADLVRGNPKKGFGVLRGLNTQLYKATHNPEYKVVFDHAQAFQDDITVTALRAEELAPDILPRIQDVWRIGLKKYWSQRGLSKADNEVVGKFMAEGTLAGGPSPLDGKVWTDAELRAKGATDNQIKYYRQARAAIDKSLEDLALAEIAQVVRMGGTKVGFNPIGLNTSFKDTVDNLWAKFDAQVQAAHAAGDADLVQKLKDTRSLALEKFDHVEAMKAAGYAPLMRFGRHSVTLTDSNGQTLFFQMFETKTEALRTAQMLRDDPEYKRAVAKVGVVPTEAFKMFSGVSLDTLEAFGASAGSMQDPMVQDLLKLTVNNRSVMKRMIQRKGTEGYSLDATRGIARFITSNARRTSTLANGAGLRTAVAQIQDGQMQDEASRLAQYVMNPGEEMAKFRGFLFANFLGGSIAAGLVNMSQPVMMTMPWLAQYGGTRKAAAAMAGSLKDTFASLRGHAIVDKDLEQALAKAENHGITNPQEIYGLMAAAENGTTSLMGAKFMRLWGANFALSEAANRRLTFVAAYKMARDMSPEERAEHKIEDPFDFAVETINQTQGIYAKQNRPNWARGAAGSVVFTFKQYSIAYCEFLRNLYGDGKLPKPAFNLAVGMLVLGAGTAGLPGSDDLDDLIDTIGAWMGYATNSKRWKQDFLSDLIGETAADIVQHGVSGIPGMPFDIAARLGLANLLPGTGLFNPTKADKSREITEVFGVAGGLAKNAIDSVNSLGQGDIGAVLKTNLPTAVRNLYQAAEMAATGEYRDRQGRKVVDVTLGDAVTKGIGFQPTTVSKDSGRASMVRGSVEIQKAKESEIVGGLVRAIHDKDPAARAEVMAKWQKWNAENPNYKVQIAPSQIASRLKAMQTTREQRLLKTTPAEIRRPIMDEIKRDKAA